MSTSYKAVTPELWTKFEELFGERGGCGGCWCMWFRQSHSEFELKKGDSNKGLIAGIIADGQTPGILAFDDERPIGWVSIAPRDQFSRLERSRILKPVDDLPVWSIVCLFVHRHYRRRGVSKGLITAAADHARSQGASLVEAYAVEPKKDEMPDTFAYHGLASAYSSCGFKEVARRSETRPIMRLSLT